MKTRTSFVANSSSSCFILLIPKDKTKTVLDTIKISHENVCSKTEILASNYEESIDVLQQEWFNNPPDETFEKVKSHKDDLNNDIIVVEISTDDEIVREYVKEFAIAKRDCTGEWYED